MSEKPYSSCGGWKGLSGAPQDGTLIEGLYDEGPCLIRWAEARRCMLAGIGGGNGYFGPGWEDDYNGLIVDLPMAWRPEGWEDPELTAANARIAELEALVKYAEGHGLVIGLNVTTDNPAGSLAHYYREGSTLDRMFDEWSDGIGDKVELARLKAEKQNP